MTGFNATRREGESLRIGEAVVTVRKISGRRIVLNVEAPPSVEISLGPSQKNQRQPKGLIVNDQSQTVSTIVKAVKKQQADELRTILDQETRLTAIYLAAKASTTLSIQTGYADVLAKVLFVETQTFNRVLIDCLKLVRAGGIEEVVQILAKETSNQSAAAIVSLLEDMRGRSSSMIATQCERIYDNPELMGIDT